MFKILKTSKDSSLRKGILKTPHGEIRTPFFMPCATVGAVKGISPDEVRELGGQIILANTYHLYLRPGEKLIKKHGGLHQFMRWDGPILTDSGGFQVFSLGRIKSSARYFSSDISRSNRTLKSVLIRGGDSLVIIKPNGVEFTSHLDGSKHFFTPEKVIQIQLDLESDIIMPLDVCPPSNGSQIEIERAVKYTVKWAAQAKKYFDQKTAVMKKRPLLFAIVQGGVDKKLRQDCLEKLSQIGDWDGFAIGGLAVGESRQKMYEIVKYMDSILPKDKPRYLMGVGEPLDIFEASRLGMDMFDCVLPTRLARHGVVWITNEKGKMKKEKVKIEKIDLRKAKYREDGGVLDKNCDCSVCKDGFSRAYLSHLVREHEILGLQFLSIHNLRFLFRLMENINDI